MSPITTHVLDTSLGTPGKGINITLFKENGEEWNKLTSGTTNSDGRISDLLAKEVSLEKGIYRMHFDIKAYFESQNRSSFYPYADIIFEINATDEHYHIPLLLSPFGYTTYRGS